MERLVNVINVAATAVTACAAPASRPNRVGMITNQPIPKLKKLRHDEKNTLIVKLWNVIEIFENAVCKKSHNSSKPPSSDGLGRKFAETAV
jgi:Family of unknown function (DUF6444)